MSMQTQYTAAVEGSTEASKQAASLAEAIDDLERVTSNLENELRYVLTGDGPLADPLTTMNVQDDVRSPLAQRLDATNRAVRSCVARLEQLRTRLDLP